MKIKLIDLKKQYEEIEESLDVKIKEIFNNSNFIMGEETKLFEKEFSNYVGTKHAISVANGTDALVISLKALGIKEGDEVITTPYTFFATAEAISYVGAKPIFVDVSLETYNIDEKLIEQKITDKTKAIMPVHIFGYPANMKEINQIAKKHKLYVIEDACQAIGAEIDSIKIGNYSDIACFSFFPTKNLGCAGDGGMIVTNNEELSIICGALKAHGSGQIGRKAYNIINNIKEESSIEESLDNTVYNPAKYYNYLIGQNSRLDEIQAAILRLKLPLIDKWTEERQKIANKYNLELNCKTIVKKTPKENIKHVYHLYIIEVSKRDNLIKHLAEKGIMAGIYYKVPLYKQEAYKYLNLNPKDFPNSEYLSENTVALPLYIGMTENEQDYIINSVKEWCESNE